MADKAKIVADPIEDHVKKKQAEQDAKADEALSIVNLKWDDLKSVPTQMRRMSHPFDGYPLEDIEIETEIKNYRGKGESVKSVVRTKKSYIVVLNNTVRVPQDQSNRGNYNPHSRVIYSYEEQRNIDVVFDRDLVIEGRKVKFALVPDHSVRAQIVYQFIDKKNQVIPDERYLMVDAKQANRLRQVFNMVIRNKMAAELRAQRFDDGVDTNEDDAA